MPRQHAVQREVSYTAALRQPHRHTYHAVTATSHTYVAQVAHTCTVTTLRHATRSSTMPQRATHRHPAPNECETKRETGCDVAPPAVPHCMRWSGWEDATWVPVASVEQLSYLTTELVRTPQQRLQCRFAAVHTGGCYKAAVVTARDAHSRASHANAVRAGAAHVKAQSSHAHPTATTHDERRCGQHCKHERPIVTYRWVLSSSAASPTACARRTSTLGSAGACPSWPSPNSLSSNVSISVVQRTSSSLMPIVSMPGYRGFAGC
jgi:hypothetical protein